MRVLITGASGAIGRAVSDALLVRGDDVFGLSRDPERAKRTNPTVRWFAWDPTLERPPGEAFEAVDAVVNLVGEPISQRWSDEAKRRILSSRETATRNLVAAISALERRPRVLVSQSGVGYYGDRGEAIIDESGPQGPGFDAGVCAAWEAAAREIAGSGVRLVILRTAPVLDADSGFLKEMLLPFKLGIGGPIAGGRNYMPWISLDDEVGLILWAIDDDSVAGIFNASAPTPTTNREFSKALGKALRRPAFLPIPKLALSVRLGSELADAATASQRVMPRRALDAGYEFRHPEIGSALAATLQR